MVLLDKSNYGKVLRPLKTVTINNLFARAVIEQTVTGKIYVDDPINSQTFYVVHPYGMTLLFGESNNEKFNEAFRIYALNKDKSRDNFEWMQVFPSNWDNVLSFLFKDVLMKSSDNTEKAEEGIIELNTRVNFKFNLAKHQSLSTQIIGKDISIVRANEQMFQEMQGSVVPLNFWDNKEDFLKNGIAFALFYKDELASMSFSSYWFGNEFEMGIETKEKFRGKGFAELVCRAIIDYCIENSYEPIWSCRLENIGSYKLAQKLGFEPTLYLPYYRLSR
jgi:GNAT superfamily N-acetyltransferase